MRKVIEGDFYAVDAPDLAVIIAHIRIDNRVREFVVSDAMRVALEEQQIRTGRKSLYLKKGSVYFGDIPFVMDDTVPDNVIEWR